MKRDKNTYPNINKIYPIFLWKECRFCGKEFKKEYGFKITKENECQCFNEDTKYNTTYCCSDCCKDENEVVQKLNLENDYRKEQRQKRNKTRDDWRCSNIGSNPEPRTKRPGIPIVKEW